MLLVACDRCNGTGFMPSDSNSRSSLHSPVAIQAPSTRPPSTTSLTTGNGPAHTGRKRSRSLESPFSHRLAQGTSSFTSVSSNQPHNHDEPSTSSQNVVCDDDDDDDQATTNTHDTEDKTYNTDRNMPRLSPSSSNSTATFSTLPSSSSTTSLLQLALASSKRSTSDSWGEDPSSSSHHVHASTSSAQQSVKSDLADDSLKNEHWNQPYTNIPHHRPKQTRPSIKPLPSSTPADETSTSIQQQTRSGEANERLSNSAMSLSLPLVDVGYSQESSAPSSAASEATSPLYGSHTRGEDSPASSSAAPASRPTLPPLKAMLNGMNDWRELSEFQ